MVKDIRNIVVVILFILWIKIFIMKISWNRKLFETC